MGAANLFGRTLADLILERESELTAMPWAIRGGVRGLRKWEPEPLPWLVYQAVQAAYGWEEALCGSDAAPAWRKRLAGRVAESLSRLLR